MPSKRPVESSAPPGRATSSGVARSSSRTARSAAAYQTRSTATIRRRCPSTNDPHPVVTEQKQVRVPGQPITQTITVTRQGDRVLSVEKPRSHYHSLDFGDLSDYED
jgi:hypothetical protein